MKPVTLFISCLLAAALLLLGVAGPAAADGCSTDLCPPPAQTVQTPVGPVTITADPTDVVTVQFAPDEPIRIVALPGEGLPSAPADAGNPDVLFRTTVDTTGGEVTIQTVTLQKLPGQRKPATLTLVRIHPPSPCRVTVSETTVVFTPLDLPAPQA
jgi:hypothetical protein